MSKPGTKADLSLFIQSFKSILLNLPVPCYILDLEGGISLSNEAATLLTGYKRKKKYKRNFISLLEDESIESTIAQFKRTLQGEQVQFQIYIKHKNGNKIPVTVVSIPLEINGSVQGLCGYIFNSTIPSVADVYLQTSNWHKHFNDMDICLWSVDAKSLATLQISSACKRILGYEEDKFFENPTLWEELLHPQDKGKVFQQLQLVEKGQSAKLEYRICTQDGGHKWIFDYIIPVYDDDSDAPGRFDRVVMDIDDRKRAEEELTFLAFHDPLTGLPNRRVLDDELHNALMDAKKNNLVVGLLFIDIDRFKDINDSLGHKMGDQLIQIVANRLRGHLRSEDVISRQGGDEFVILLKNLPNGQIIDEMAAGISQVFAEPIILLNHEYRMSVSIGTSFFPDHGQDAETLLMKADHAMYLAKENKTGIQQYQTGMSTTLSRKMLLEQNLHMAVEKDELYLEYQPICDVNAKQVIGLEALLRWKHPVLGAISPGEFIQIAEESDLIIKLNHWVLAAVCRQRRLWADQDLPPFYISINVPARQIHQSDFIATVKEMIYQYNLPPQFIKIEITERTAMTNVEKTLNTMRKLQEFGVDCILDDFGIGYSSISYLVQYPFNTIKIDKAFVQGLNNKNQRSICRALVAMGSNLGMNVVAEGVEELEQYHYLCSIGCHKMQGYYFSKPTSVELVEKFF